MADKYTSSQPLTSPEKTKSITPDDLQLHHAPEVGILEESNKTVCEVKRLSIPVEESRTTEFVTGFLHLPARYLHKKNSTTLPNAGAILLSGASGGVVGPSSIYLSIGDKLASVENGIPVLRLDYRYPARNKNCVRDVLAAMKYLQGQHGVSKVVLVGWSFGGAPVFTVGGNEPDRVCGCATVASQTADAMAGVRRLRPRPVLLLHGTGDKVLSPLCSRQLYDAYGPSGDRTIKLFEGDDHALNHNALAAEKLLCSFIAKCVGLEVGKDDHAQIVAKELVEEEDRIPLMKRGGDLRGNETVN